MTISPFVAHPTVYRGVKMRSRLEAHWAARLDRAAIAWEYEPKAFANERGQYLPDFQYAEHRPGGRRKTVYLELKGVVAHPDTFTDRMEIIWSSEPEATLILVEGHGDRYWLGFMDPEGRPCWFEHEGDPT